MRNRQAIIEYLGLEMEPENVGKEGVEINEKCIKTAQLIETKYAEELKNADTFGYCLTGDETRFIDADERLEIVEEIEYLTVFKIRNKHLLIRDRYSGHKYEVSIYTDTYATNGNLFVGLLCKEEYLYEPYCDLTVNLDEKLPQNCAYIDTNNNGASIMAWLTENKLGKPTGRYGASGYCVYPEFEFDMEELNKWKLTN